MIADKAESVAADRSQLRPHNFDLLTAKQHEVFALVAEGRTTKEIAWRLNVTDSAVNQRIEAVRSRAGSPPRAELARAYRRYMALRAAEAGEYGAFSDDTNAQVVDKNDVPAGIDGHLHCGDIGHDANSSQWIVPNAFVGPGAGLNRVAAIMVVAVGLLSAASLGLAVVLGLNALF